MKLTDELSKVFYTAMQARRILGLDEESLQYWGKTKRITRTYLPNRKHPVYSRQEIDTIAAKNEEMTRFERVKKHDEGGMKMNTLCIITVERILTPDEVVTSASPISPHAPEMIAAIECAGWSVVFLSDNSVSDNSEGVGKRDEIRAWIGKYIPGYQGVATRYQGEFGLSALTWKMSVIATLLALHEPAEVVFVDADPEVCGFASDHATFGVFTSTFASYERLEAAYSVITTEKAL